jgi:hypothetical protein
MILFGYVIEGFHLPQTRTVMPLARAAVALKRGLRRPLRPSKGAYLARIIQRGLADVAQAIDLA